MYSIKISIFCSLNAIVKKKMKWQAIDWEKTFILHKYEKGRRLVSRIYRELLQFNKNKSNDLMKNG